MLCRREGFVMWFEDVPLGEKFTIGSYAFTEENIVAFARKYNPQPFHLDKQAAARSPYRGLTASAWDTTAKWLKSTIPFLQGRGAVGEQDTPPNDFPTPGASV